MASNEFTSSRFLDLEVDSRHYVYLGFTSKAFLCFAIYLQ